MKACSIWAFWFLKQYFYTSAIQKYVLSEKGLCSKIQGKCLCLFRVCFLNQFCNFKGINSWCLSTCVWQYCSVSNWHRFFLMKTWFRWILFPFQPFHKKNFCQSADIESYCLYSLSLNRKYLKYFLSSPCVSLLCYIMKKQLLLQWINSPAKIVYKENIATLVLARNKGMPHFPLYNSLFLVGFYHLLPWK